MRHELVHVTVYNHMGHSDNLDRMPVDISLGAAESEDGNRQSHQNRDRIHHLQDTANTDNIMSKGIPHLVTVLERDKNQERIRLLSKKEVIKAFFQH